MQRPREVRKLAAPPGHPPRLQRRRREWQAGMLEIRHTRLLAEARLRALAAGAPPCLLARDNRRLPATRILAASE